MPESITVTEVVNQVIISDPYVVVGGGGGGGGVTDHGALTGLADDDHTQYLIGNVGTSTTRNSITMGSGARGLNIDAADGVDTWLRLTVGGVEQATWSWDGGLSTSGLVVANGFISTTGQITGAASTVSAASLRLPHGTAPTSPVNGDVWTTTAGVFARVNGSTVGPLGVPAGSNTQIQYNSAGTLAASSDLTYNPVVGEGLSVNNGNIIFGSSKPARHTSTTVFAIFPGGAASNAYIGYNTGTTFTGLNINSNRVYDSGGNWVCADTSRPCWAMYMAHGTSADMFEISRGPATSGTANTTAILRIDQNLRSAFLAASFANTTGFTAKLAVDNVGGTASDSVLTLRGNASQSGNYFTAQTSGGTAVAQITSGGSLTINTAGQGLRVAEGSNAKQGTAVLVAGTVTVSNTSVTANSRIFLTSQSDGGTPGFLRVSARVAGTSFTITSSSGTDTSTVAYQIFEPA